MDEASYDCDCVSIVGSCDAAERGESGFESDAEELRFFLLGLFVLGVGGVLVGKQSFVCSANCSEFVPFDLSPVFPIENWGGPVENFQGMLFLLRQFL